MYREKLTALESEMWPELSCDVVDWTGVVEELFNSVMFLGTMRRQHFLGMSGDNSDLSVIYNIV